MPSNYLEARERYRDLLRKKARLQRELTELEADIAEALIEMQRLAEQSYINAEQETLTLADAAKLLNVSYHTVYQMAREGRIQTIRFGRTYRVPRRALRELIGRNGGSPETKAAAGVMAPARKE